MKEIIVRADDLGFSEGVNYGIEKACRDGIIRSVGVMTNMEASEHGYQLIRDLPLCLGLHTNICAGRPLCDPAEIPSICDEHGNLKRSAVYRQASREGWDFIVLEEVIKEIEAQYQAFVSLTGDKPHYFEGHAVSSPSFSLGLKTVAESHGCDYLDFSIDGPIHFRNSLLYVSMNSSQPDYDPFECLKQAAMQDYGDNGYAMFVCHPGYLDQTILDISSLTLPRPKEVAMCTDPRTRQWLSDNDIRVITYDDLP
ncbi:MAG: ChbG/HpnK family deacetylase [Erysipelotrichaceae bacterium]|nr:ChbG/HpnK family deacetylase [Erysipelotrichaceae bacterium]